MRCKKNCSTRNSHVKVLYKFTIADMSDFVKLNSLGCGFFDGPRSLE